MLGFIREDDVVYVEEFFQTRPDCIWSLKYRERIENTGAKFVSLKENFDTSTPTGRLQLTMMAAIAEFEREMILERQREGIAIAKKKDATKEETKSLFLESKNTIIVIWPDRQRKRRLQKNWK